MIVYYNSRTHTKLCSVKNKGARSRRNINGTGIGFCGARRNGNRGHCNNDDGYCSTTHFVISYSSCNIDNAHGPIFRFLSHAQKKENRAMCEAPFGYIKLLSPIYCKWKWLCKSKKLYFRNKYKCCLTPTTALLCVNLILKKYICYRSRLPTDVTDCSNYDYLEDIYDELANDPGK